jgi:hypothetical protein
MIGGHAHLQYIQDSRRGSISPLDYRSYFNLYRHGAQKSVIVSSLQPIFYVLNIHQTNPRQETRRERTRLSGSTSGEQSLKACLLDALGFPILLKTCVRLKQMSPPSDIAVNGSS